MNGFRKPPVLVRADRIPRLLAERKQWITWRLESRGGEDTKVPYTPGGGHAKSNDQATWRTIDEALSAYMTDGSAGVGFVFSPTDPFVGIDLDGCREPSTGAISDWAVKIIERLDTYAEVSPSGTGVKLFCIGTNPLGGGRKVEVKAPSAGGKTPAIEVYSEGRYFAVTGYRGGKQTEPQERSDALNWLKREYFTDAPAPMKADFYAPASVVDRAMKYLATMPPAISGQGGHNKTFQAACVLVLGFGLSQEEAYQAILEWNARCDPPWSERELRHKIADADKQPGDRNYLRNSTVQNQHRVAVPTYKPPLIVKPPVERATIAASAKDVIERIRRGEGRTSTLGVREIDSSIGGFAPGEVIILAGRPSHGKSAVALQFIHHRTKQGEGCVVISEEMSRHMIGRRTLQFITNLPEDQWEHCTEDLERELAEYSKCRAPCYIVENCGRAETAVAELEKHAADGATFAVVDYAQLLQAPGKSAYETTTNVCKMLVAGARRLKMTLVMLSQFSRAIESRDVFQPRMKDLKESGQFEQDADVILGVVWPFKIDQTQPREDYQVYVLKNRSRDTREPVIKCSFDAAHQRIAEQETNWQTPSSIMVDDANNPF